MASDVVAVLVVAPLLDDPADAVDAGAGSAAAGGGPPSCCGAEPLACDPASDTGGAALELELELSTGAAAVAVLVTAPDEPADVSDTPLPALTPLSPASDAPVEVDGPSACAGAVALVAVGAA
jgi:hypothetical protein